MKKILNLLLLFILVISLLAGCAANKSAEQSVSNQKENKETATETTKYKDGIYTAQEDNFDEKSGWKNVVTLEVKKGEIVSVDWNGVHKNLEMDKKTASKKGKYPMVENGGAKAPWHEQAEKAEAFLLETQDPTAIIYTDNEGHTDAISGVSIHVLEFFELAKEALADAQ